jgi:hypothetical protein
MPRISLEKAVATASALTAFGVMAAPAAAVPYLDGGPAPVQLVPSLSSTKPDRHESQTQRFRTSRLSKGQFRAAPDGVVESPEAARVSREHGVGHERLDDRLGLCAREVFGVPDRFRAPGSPQEEEAQQADGRHRDERASDETRQGDGNRVPLPLPPARKPTKGIVAPQTANRQFGAKASGARAERKGDRRIRSRES